jgi:hypothetical protein
MQTRQSRINQLALASCWRLAVSQRVADAIRQADDGQYGFEAIGREVRRRAAVLAESGRTWTRTERRSRHRNRLAAENA